MTEQNLPREVISDTPSKTQGEKMGFVQRATVPFTRTSEVIGSGVQGLAGLVKLEVVLTIVCFCIPLIVWIGDGLNFRKSISAYYAMTEAQYFYFPLTVAAMLFIVNGVVRDKHWYNVGLGLALVGVVFFNHLDHSVIHNISAATFFIGNAVVFVLFTPKKELWFKVALAITVIIGLAGYFVFDWYSLFCAEALSLWVIALHFLLEAMGLWK